MTAPTPPIARTLVAGLLLSAAGACATDAPRLGPVDGLDLPPADTGRVAVGDIAPDFSLEAFGGDVVTLSEYRGAKDVILVFYRGHW